MLRYGEFLSEYIGLIFFTYLLLRLIRTCYLTYFYIIIKDWMFYERSNCNTLCRWARPRY